MASNSLYIVVQSLDQLRKIQYPDPNAIYYLTQTRKEGMWKFDPDDVESADNSGTIVVTTNEHRFKRIFNDRVLQLNWFDVVLDGLNDDYPAVRAALDYADEVGDIAYIQATGDKYMMSESLEITGPTEIRGSKIFNINPQTTFAFQGNIPGFIVTNRLSMSNVTIKQENSSQTFDPAEVGMRVRAISHFLNVVVWNFQGDGIVIYGNGTEGTNTDQSTFTNVKARENRGRGFYIYGEDSNIIMFSSCEAVANACAGFVDDGFLGNAYLNCHTAANGGPETQFQRAIVVYDGVVYYALLDGLLGQPDISPTEWGILPAQQYADPLYLLPIYDPEVEYRRGGAYLLDTGNTLGHNQYSTLLGLYAEQDNPPSYWSEKCIALGGDLPPHGIRGGVFVGGFNGFMNVNQRVRVSGENDSQTVSLLTNDGVQFGVKIAGGQGIVAQWNDTDKAIVFRDQASYAPNSNVATWNGPWIGSSETPAASFFRNSADMAGGMLLENLFFVNSVQGTRSSKMRMRDTVPSTGTWQIGDIVWKSIAGAGDTVLGWRCVASGTPGTWETLNVTIS